MHEIENCLITSGGRSNRSIISILLNLNDRSFHFKQMHFKYYTVNIVTIDSNGTIILRVFCSFVLRVISEIIELSNFKN